MPKSAQIFSKIQNLQCKFSNFNGTFYDRQTDKPDREDIAKWLNMHIYLYIYTCTYYTYNRIYDKRHKQRSYLCVFFFILKFIQHMCRYLAYCTCIYNVYSSYNCFVVVGWMSVRRGIIRWNWLKLTLGRVFYLRSKCFNEVLWVSEGKIFDLTVN